MKKLSFNCHDFGMFDAELTGPEYEFFMKHTGAFKRMMQDEPREQKQRFLYAFCDFFLNHGEMRSLTVTSSTGADHKKKFLEIFRQYAQETFIKGRYSASKQFVNDAFVVSRNKHMIQYMDSQSYAKDPFFHKDTREVFRRLFGEPHESGTCIKVICLLPLYVRFAGAMCRYLRRWLEANETSEKLPGKPTKRKTKEENEEENDRPAVMVFKIDRGGVQEIRRTPSGAHKITHVEDPAYLQKAGFPWPHMARSADCVDAELAKERKRESDRLTQHLEEEQDRLMNERQRVREEKQSVVKEGEKKDKNAKAKEPVVSNVTGEYSKTVSSDGKVSEVKTSEVKTSEVKISEEKLFEETRPGRKVTEEKISEVKSSEEKVSESKISEVKSLEGKFSEVKIIGKSFQEKTHLSKIDSSIDDDCCDNADDRCIKETFPELHLGEPHPNKVYDNMVEEEKTKGKSSSILKSATQKLHLCAFCRVQENKPKLYKKCGKCKGKGTKFYCGQGCQKSDWQNHRAYHQG